jgi:hypothetical protein
MPVGRHAGIEVIPTAAGPVAVMTGVRCWIRSATGRWSCCGRWHHVGGPVRIVRWLGSPWHRCRPPAWTLMLLLGNRFRSSRRSRHGRNGWNAPAVRRGYREQQIVVIRADKRRAAPNDEQCGSWRSDPCWCRDRSASRCLMAARRVRTGLRTRNTRNAGAIRGTCPVPATPPRSAVPDNVWSPKQVQKQAAVPYPGSVWSATQASTWIQVCWCTILLEANLGPENCRGHQITFAQSTHNASSKTPTLQHLPQIKGIDLRRH